MTMEMSMKDYLSMCGVEWFQIEPLNDNQHLVSIDGMSKEYATRKLNDAGYDVFAMYENTALEVVYAVIKERA